MTTQTTQQTIETDHTAVLALLENGTPDNTELAIDAYIGTCSAWDIDTVLAECDLGTVTEERPDGRYDVWNGDLLDYYATVQRDTDNALRCYDVSSRAIDCDACGAPAITLSDYSGIAFCDYHAASAARCDAWAC